MTSSEPGDRDRRGPAVRAVRAGRHGDAVLEDAGTVPVAATFDVVVVGGGPAGVCAAIAAAREGARTALVERAAFLGGTATGAMVASFMGFFWKDLRVVGGIPLEVTERLVARDASPGFGRYVLAEASDNPIDVITFPFDPEVLKIVLDGMLVDAGVTPYLHAQAVEPVMDGSACVGVVYQGPVERRALLATTVVDASAHGSIAVRAGAEREAAREDPRKRQPMTQIARVVGVDVARFRALPREEKRRIAEEGLRRGVLAQKLLPVLSSPHGDDAIVLMTRVTGRDGTDESELALAEIEGRRMIDGLIPFLRGSLPGFENARLGTLASWIGVRETWRVVGHYVVDEHDVLYGTAFEDVIALGAGPLDVHHAAGGGISLAVPDRPFPIPYRALVPRGVDGMLVAGRCVSATRKGMAGLRHMGTAMALGQAAGSAAALSAAASATPLALDTAALTAALARGGAVLDAAAAVPYDDR
ncbi:FAD dependent oxidoreductase [Sinosporangium album]|uniref:FAD dependent oxidoreductase n=1 Tax=Sinosporangium album TaxID=504805 RepID=A0A1G7ZN16_9ACTN|nr:FAD-dependent oxidoreductase [Sinosporangium album]SDH10152.1 FAD dependent oxidoreductase [Sinosporangium album]